MNSNNPTKLSNLDKIQNFFSQLVDLVFGYDFFISYAHDDGKNYPQQLTQALQEKEGFKCFLDSQVFTAGENLRAATRRRVRMSKYLAIVAREKSLQSIWVDREIDVAINSKRSIIVIDINDSYSKSDESIKERLSDYLRIEEKLENPDGNPTEEVVEELKRSFKAKKQNTFRLQVATGLGLLLFILFLIAIGAAFYANYQKNEAERQRDTALSKKFLAQGQNSITKKIPSEALDYSLKSLEVLDSKEARLLVAESVNMGVPKELNYFDEIYDLTINPKNNDVLAAIGFKSDLEPNNNQIKIWNLENNSEIEISGNFTAIEFSPDGNFLYAAAITNLDTVYSSDFESEIIRKVGIIKFDLNLSPIETYKTEVITYPNEPNFYSKKGKIEYDIREYQDIKFSKNGNFLILAGWASETVHRNISNAFPHHLRTWIDLETKIITHKVDKSELSAFHRYEGKVILLNDNLHLVSDGIEEIYLDNMKTGSRVIIGKHTSSVTGLASNTSGNKIAAVGSDNRLSIFSKKNDKEWIRSVYNLPRQTGCDLVVFISEYEVAVTRNDFSITLFSLKEDEYFESQKLILDGYTEFEVTRSYSIKGHTAKINSIKISPDNKWLAAASEDKTIRLWSLYEYNERIFYGSKRGVRFIEFSNDSKNVLAGGPDGTIRRFDVENKYTFSISSNPNEARREYFLTDSKLDEGGGLTRAIIRDHVGFIRNIQYSKDYKYIGVVNYDNKLTLWDNNFVLIDVLDTTRSYFGFFNHINYMFIFGSGTNKLDSKEGFEIWDINKREQISVNTNVIPNKYLLSPKGQYAEISDDKQLILHSMSEGIDTQKLVEGCFSPNGEWFINLDYENKEINVWDLKDPTSKSITFNQISGSLNQDSYRIAKFSENNNFFGFPCYFNGKAICILDLQKMKTIIFQEDIVPYDFDFDSENNQIVIPGRTGEIYVYSITNNSTKKYLKHSRYVTSVAFSPDGEWFASGSRDRTVRLWSNPNGNFIEFKFLNPVEKVFFSQDGKRLLVISGTGLHSWYIPTGDKSEVIQENKKFDAYNIKYSNITEEFDNNKNHLLNLGFISKYDNKVSRLEYVQNILNKKVEITDKRKRELIGLLTSKDVDDNIKIRTAIELSAFEDKALDMVPHISNVLKTEDYYSNSFTNVVIDLLKSIGPTAEEPLLKTFDTSNDPKVKIGIANSIPLLFPDSTLAKNTLEKALININFDIALVAALNLDKIDYNEAVIPIFATALYSGHKLRKEASVALIKYKRKSLSPLINVFRSNTTKTDDPPKDLARESLAKIGEDAVPMLIQSLRNTEENNEFRENIIRTLGRIGPDSIESVEYLIEILKQDYNKEENYSLVEEVVRTLGNIGPKANKAIPYLIEIIINTDKPQLDAHYSLTKIGPDAIDHLVSALPKSSGYTKSLIIETLGEYKTEAKKAVPLISEALLSNDEWTPNAAVEALGKIGPDASDAIPDLVIYLESARRYSRGYVVKTLGIINSKQEITIPAIISALETENNKGYKIKHKVTKRSIKMLKSEGVPEDVLLELEDLNDMARTGDIFLNIVYRRIGYEKFNLYASQILKHTKYKGKYNCDDYGFYREASISLSKFGNTARQAIPILEKTLSTHSNCIDISKYLKESLDIIKYQKEY